MHKIATTFCRYLFSCAHQAYYLLWHKLKTICPLCPKKSFYELNSKNLHQVTFYFKEFKRSISRPSLPPSLPPIPLPLSLYSKIKINSNQFTISHYHQAIKPIILHYYQYKIFFHFMGEKGKYYSKLTLKGLLYIVTIKYCNTLKRFGL